MSGHSKWAKIKHKKGAEDAKRGALFTKLSKEITAAAKEKGGNMETNFRLRAAVARAREYNMPQSNVENAIKKGTGEIPGIVFENVTFDARLGAVAFLIEGLTDNKNRTTAEVRNLLNKKGAALAGAGSSARLFTKKGYLTVDKSKATEDAVIEAAVLDAGADDVIPESDVFEIYCDPTQLEAVKNALTAKKIETVSAEVTMVPDRNSVVTIEGHDARNVLGLIEALEENEDIQYVYANFDISDEEMAKLSAE
jgi:YebC/PmpR family DNA-binding regulatory protein